MNMENKIKEIIDQNRNNIAFVIGNGVNRRFLSDVKSWMELLESLWNKYGSRLPKNYEWEEFLDTDEDNNAKGLKGITLTEIFDLIELNWYSQAANSERQAYFRSGIKLPITMKSLSPIEREGLKEMPEYSYSKSRAELINEFQGKNRKLEEKCREWCNDNLLEADRLSDFECVLKMMEVLSNSTKNQLYRNQLKKDIAHEYDNQKDNSDFSRLMEILKGMNAPVLTTNFDNYMSDSLGLKPIKMGAKFTDFYPWNVYFSDRDLYSPIDGFGIWHVNGMIDYPRSIKIGLSDYMGCVERARNMIHSTNMNEFFDGKNNDFWVGRNTWLHVVFNKPLFVFGLALDENEVFLRWLLIQRAKYSRMYGRPLGGWFVDKGISNGKQVFLKALGFHVLNITDYNELYDAFV